MQKKKIKIPIYFGTLTMVKYLSEEEFEREFPIELDGCEAISLARRNKRTGVTDYLVAINGNYNTKGSVIAHESVHLCNFIFKDRGLVLDVENDEAQAYLTGWLFEQISEFLIKTK